jgi:LmbE family N-acetylglucosaminyl deacetylase
MANDIVIEREQPGQPHKGKVFAAVHAHLDDIPYYAAGLCTKLMHEGYTGYIIRTTNDEKCGGRTTAENILSNEQEHFRMAEVLGFKDVFDLYYQNHEMDGISTIEVRARLVLIFRLLKVDTIVSFNPYGDWEENPDHWMTGRAVEGGGGLLDVRHAERLSRAHGSGPAAAQGAGALLLPRPGGSTVQPGGGYRTLH